MWVDRSSSVREHFGLSSELSSEANMNRVTPLFMLPIPKWKRFSHKCTGFSQNITPLPPSESLGERFWRGARFGKLRTCVPTWKHPMGHIDRRGALEVQLAVVHYILA